jgi:hypothetical protein
VEKLYKIPLLFFFIASCMGMMLRSQLIFPIEGINFSFLLHGHSHVMFLGWVFNTLFIAFVVQFIVGDHNTFRIIFWMLQVQVVGMLISFPLQGYGVYSITFSALHTFTVLLFVILFFKRTRARTDLSVWLARISLIFFAISSAGPFSLGYLKANDLDHTNLYRYAIYFYLHFQYNGFFFFGILSLFVNLLERSLSKSQIDTMRFACQLLAAACIPAFLLSTLWAKPGIVYNILGGFAALVQLVSLVIFSIPLRKFFRVNPDYFRPGIKLLLIFIYSAVALKFLLQLLSADPGLAGFINDNRSLVIAYLHLVLVGIISLFLLAWLTHKAIIDSAWGISLLLIGFLGSECILFVFPWNEGLLNADPIILQLIILVLSGLMVAGVFAFLQIQRKSS